MPGPVGEARLDPVGLYREHLQPRLLNATMATSAATAIRRRVCAGLAGEVLEIGYGSGLNQPHLPAGVRRVLAVDPSATGFRLSARRRAASPVPVLVIGGDAQALPVPDEHVDAVLSTWNLCAVADPAAALREVRRVLRPGGLFHFVEHGLAPDDGVVRRQRRGNAMNRRVAGCVLDRDVRALLDGSGLQVLTLSTYYEEGAPKPAGYFYEGRARA